MNKTTRLLEVPYNFYKNEYFKCEPAELKIFLENLIGWVEGNEVYLPLIDIDKTIEMHSGDCRIWFQDNGGYETMIADKLIMECTYYYYDNIYDWLFENIPTLYKKHLDYEDRRK